MDEDWKNTIGILMCAEICDGAGAGIWDSTPSTCSSCIEPFIVILPSSRYDPNQMLLIAASFLSLHFVHRPVHLN